jgi:hypothetical protein
MFIEPIDARRLLLISLAVLTYVSLISVGAFPAWPQSDAELRAPGAFSNITDLRARSRALFAEAAKVIMNPRCMNCHPAGDEPTQAMTCMNIFRRCFEGRTVAEWQVTRAELAT